LGLRLWEGDEKGGIAWLGFDGMMCIYGRNWEWTCIIGGVYGGFDVGIPGERKAMLCSLHLLPYF
jgi:hypothetical protein